MGLGDGPARPFPLRAGAWEEAGYRYALEERVDGVWRFTHDPFGSFAGFAFDLTASAASAAEFAAYHEYYWHHPRRSTAQTGCSSRRGAQSLG